MVSYILDFYRPLNRKESPQDDDTGGRKEVENRWIVLSVSF